MISWDICKERYTCADSGHFHTEYSIVHFPTTNLRIMQVYSLHITRPLRISKKVLSSHQMGRNLSPLFLDKKKLRKASYYIVHTYDMLFSSHYVPLGPRAYTGFMSCMWFFVLIFWQHIHKK